MKHSRSHTRFLVVAVLTWSLVVCAFAMQFFAPPSEKILECTSIQPY